MSDTYVQLAAELDAYSAGVLPPLKRTKPPTGEEIHRSVRELITHIDQALVSVAGRLRALDGSLKEQQQRQTGDDEPIPPRTPQEMLDQLQLCVANPAKRRRHSWKSLGIRLRKVIKQVNEKQTLARQQTEQNQRYLEQREEDGKNLWSWRPPGNKPEPKRRRKRKLSPASTDKSVNLNEGIGSVVNVAVMNIDHLLCSSLAVQPKQIAESNTPVSSSRKPRRCPRRRQNLVRRLRQSSVQGKQATRSSNRHVSVHPVAPGVIVPVDRPVSSTVNRSSCWVKRNQRCTNRARAP
ncbi:hypothetical protein DTL21_16040 [Bremerella cremea]|uniref:Uncharacterized protein n=1 Tax=Blastopirellula marina TaxID=124 RepID=A0A2S8FT26_9BACT|nr:MULTISPECIES: hypothetical protein [Pirellulaceae]PQO34984.1 hypothetical protein C5Y83_16025 [Blastopirellula marina]RCS47485.1 hypothetical protein DTL21_16040 [Bremerella cremea]